MNTEWLGVFIRICGFLGLAFLCSISSSVSAQEHSAGSKATTAMTTPHTADGHVDFTGLWHVAFGAQFLTSISPDGKERGVYVKTENGEDGKALEEHVAGIAKRKVEARDKETNYPPYKPEFLPKIKDLEDHYVHYDPTFRCEPPGVPRLGPAHQIVQSPGQVVFLYATNVGNFFRVIPTDGRAHRADLDPSYMGDSVAHWEGDALVVDVVGFNDITWLAPDRGFIHSESMHVVERYTREGNTLKYQATVEDPVMFTRPWIMNPRTVKIGGPDDILPEADPCNDKDEPHMPQGVYVY